MIRVFENRAGFALPTILIASMVMLIVLITSVSATSSVRSGLDGQYYTQLAREAAESGLARANGCLQDSGYISTWDTSALYPNTSCTGGYACTNSASCFVMQRPTIRTSFTVGPPENQTVSQVVRSIGKVELLRASNGEVWRTYTFTASGRIGKDLSFSTVAFGYSGGNGGYFATIAADGKIQATGYNGSGQLGNGTTSSTLTPTKFKLNGDDKASAIFTNFLSNGINMFVLTDKGTVYGAGSNDRGQLGDGTFTSPRSTPVKFGLPAGVTAKFVDIAGSQTYVLGNDNNLYSSGACNNGLLGYSYTISGCANKSTYTRVALPTVNATDLNTIPTTNIVTDYLSTFVLMQGGKVYGWGNNGHTQFGNTTTETAVPMQLGTFGNTGQPKATQIQTDGISFWVVDDQGTAWAAGYNYYGELGGGATPMAVDSLGKCVDNKSGNGIDLQFYTCNDTVAQEWTWRTDGTIYNAATNRCMNVLANNSTVNLATCNTSTSQKFTFRNDRTVMNTSSGKCLNNGGNDGVTIIVYTCGAYTNEYMFLYDTDKFNPIPIPASSGNVIKISSDQWSASLLTDTGDVYCFGANDSGQCGDGSASTFQPFPAKFILPGGVTAKDIISTAYGAPSGSYFSTFVVGSNGKVYGAGANAFGQLGDGTTTNRSTPVAMLGIDGVSVRAKQVLSGNGTTVVITEDKKVYTVGNNANGELGDGTTTSSSTPHANRYTNVLPLTSF
ncbi:MAG: hypothetical protein JWP06_213 [Candidatus Saccharibacteria bacterium]|nr:hypothetical protein [Candidatus Saccharibacteria bacterium]